MDIDLLALKLEQLAIDVRQCKFGNDENFSKIGFLLGLDTGVLRRINIGDNLLLNRNSELKSVIDSVAIHTMHILYILDSDHHQELKHFFDAMPRGLLQHVSEIQSHCAQAGCKVAQTGKREDIGKWQ